MSGRPPTINRKAEALASYLRTKGIEKLDRKTFDALIIQGTGVAIRSAIDLCRTGEQMGLWERRQHKGKEQGSILIRPT